MGVRAADRTVWDGVYTTAQADRGKTFFNYSCRGCHSEDLSGGIDLSDASEAPALRRQDFGITRRNLENIFSFMRENMPRDEPGSLEDSTYAALLAYVLQQNGMPAGPKELPPDPETLKGVLIVKKP